MGIVDALEVVQIEHDKRKFFASALLAEALAEYDQKLARQEALRSAFQSSGKSVKEFADMYGLNPREVGSMLKPAL